MIRLNCHWWLGWRHWTGTGDGTTKGFTLRIAEFVCFRLPATVAGGLDNPKQFLQTSNLSLNFFHARKTGSSSTTAGQSLQCKIFACAFCNKTWFYKNTKRAHCASNSLAQIWLEIWPSEIALNGKQTQRCASTRVNTHVPTVETHGDGCFGWAVAVTSSESHFDPQNFLWRWKFSVIWLSVLSESHLKPPTLIQCNLKWIQLQ